MSESPDALAVWCRVRQQVDWSTVVPADPVPPVRGAVDGLAVWYDGPVRRRDPARAERLLTALARSRADAARGEPLGPQLPASWQRLVLGVPEAPFRDGDAFAKGGRERYGLTPHTWRDFTGCLRESTDAAVPLPARAAGRTWTCPSSTLSRTATPACP
ncbi:hypothetical protein ACFY1J_23380 [Streptomyces sp. NPDC001406]|uniref:hypothetical protein n=1 Tax=Streptomyces sp. NPDC001406 TaxID=3364572 RepID=UPI0036985A22